MLGVGDAMIPNEFASKLWDKHMRGIIVEKAKTCKFLQIPL